MPWPKSKVKINKWIGIPDIRRYETFVTDWHYFLKKVEEILKHFEDEASLNNIYHVSAENLFLMPYDESQIFILVSGTVGKATIFS